MTQRHKHADVIIAWANGATIQIETEDGRWLNYDEPFWVTECSYRIKPTPKQLWARPFSRKGSTFVETASKQHSPAFGEIYFDWVGPAVLVWEES